MTYKQIEASREARLWIGQVIVPAAIIVGGILSNPDTRRKANEKFDKFKTSVKAKFQKK